jgi:hypothetical protein
LDIVIKEIEKEQEIMSRKNKRAVRKQAEEEARSQGGGEEHVVKVEGRPSGPLFV